MARVARGIKLGYGKVKRATDSALYVELTSGDALWVPKKQIHDDSEVYAAEHEGVLIVNAWWAKDHGLA